MRKPKTSIWIIPGLIVFLFTGCASIGPDSVVRDRSDYTAAISESWKRQMLFNMVKIRYGDAPVFVDVTSVISQYQVAGQINLGTTIVNDPWSTSQTLAATGQYFDRPTVTYTPIMGDKFARSLMTPVPPSAILSLIQSGYPVDLVLRMLVQEINGIRNRFGGEARSQSADQNFYVLLQKMRKIQLAGGVGMRVNKMDKQEAALLIFRGKRGPEIEALSAEVRKMLGLNSEASDFKVVYGAIPRDDKEIAILTRSFLEVIVDLSADIEVPAAHVEEKRVGPTHTEHAAGGETIKPLIRIQSSSARPENAFILIPYRNTYFWIDDRDLMSKRLFSFLMFVFTLVETGEKGTTPIVTVPTG
ncbi:MAG TPA: hypothetical protein DCR97_06005 [Deltaproteobacteria bacterium]|nr:hypothetical protein [Deltaproteobacteria bacterium]